MSVLLNFQIRSLRVIPLFKKLKQKIINNKISKVYLLFIIKVFLHKKLIIIKINKFKALNFKKVNNLNNQILFMISK